MPKTKPKPAAPAKGMAAPVAKNPERLRLEMEWQRAREARFFTDDQLVRLLQYVRRMRKEEAAKWLV